MKNKLPVPRKRKAYTKSNYRAECAIWEMEHGNLIFIWGGKRYYS